MQVRILSGVPNCPVLWKGDGLLNHLKQVQLLHGAPDTGPIAQWIEYKIPNLVIHVRIMVGSPLLPPGKAICGYDNWLRQQAKLYEIALEAIH